jgi:hypothetical protein
MTARELINYLMECGPSADVSITVLVGDDRQTYYTFAISKVDAYPKAKRIEITLGKTLRELKALQDGRVV